MQALLKRPALLVAVALVLAVAYLYGTQIGNYLRYGLPVGAAAASKLACSLHFISARPRETLMAQDLKPLNPVLGAFDLSFDLPAQQVSASLWGRFERRAQYRPPFGCTPVPPGTDRLPPLALLLPERPVERLPSGPAVAALQAAVEREMQSPDTRAVLVLREGKLLASAYASGFDEHSKFLSWSVAKSMTASAVGVLIARGQLSLQQDHLFPEWADDARSGITLLNLLQMSSGLDFSEQYGPGSDVTNMLFVEPDMAAFVAASPLAAEPGSLFKYSSGTTVLLMRILRESFDTLEAYHRFIFDEVLAPMGLHSVEFEADASGLLVGSSSLFATAPDYARFAQFYLRLAQGAQSDLLPRDWYQTVSTPAPAALQAQYGAQFWLNRAGTRFAGVPEDALMSLGHNGQVLAVLPSHNAVLLRLGWSTDGRFTPEGFIVRMLEAL